MQQIQLRFKFKIGMISFLGFPPALSPKEFTGLKDMKGNADKKLEKWLVQVSG